MKITEKFKYKKKDILIKRQLKNHNYICAAIKARKWIRRNTIDNSGIVITSKHRKIYQEVTGYYIPTLLQWGMRDDAICYARYLCSIQEESGAWLNFAKTTESVFNTGQVLRGLVAISDILPEVKDNIIKGCDWLLSNVTKEGRLMSTPGTIWPNNGINSELIHLYCLPPIKEVGNKYQNEEYMKMVKKITEYYKRNYRDDIENFNYLSHFYAYVLEALVDLGEIDIAKKAMDKIKKIQRIDGAVPAYKNCTWVCSTGLFQLAIIWFKLGEYDLGDKAFDYAVSLQNSSGGWFGGYPTKVRTNSENRNIYLLKEKVNYFPNEEISWAVKYFLDALNYREKLEFEQKAHTFLKQIDSKDSKFKIIYDEISKMKKEKNPLKILDVGCGKGRYLRKLILRYPDNQYYGIDISEKVLRYINNHKIHKSLGSILNIHNEDNTFDVVFATESLEHAIYIDLALKEMTRVLKRGGKLIIIDKDESSFDSVKYLPWIDPKELSTKQWLNKEYTIQIMKNLRMTNIQTYFIPTAEGNMFRAFIGEKSE